MTIAEQLGTTYFQLSSVGVGALAVGVEDIRQRIYNLLNTIPGSDPLRSLFGCKAYLYTDAPLPVAIPNIKKEIIDSITLWMPEIQVVAITDTIVGTSQLVFNIVYALIDSDLVDSILFSLGSPLTGGDSGNSIIISTLVPVQQVNGVYRITFIVNGDPVHPSIPVQGFASPGDMLSWINQNWANYGKWYLTGNTLILYLNTGIANTASISVTETVEITLQQLIPVLGSGEFYDLAFTIDGNPPVPDFATNLTTPGGLLSWLNSNWGDYGSWSITGQDNNGDEVDFSDDFSDDFATESDELVNYYLLFQTSDHAAATLNFE